jgi:hypothetical protein
MLSRGEAAIQDLTTRRRIQSHKAMSAGPKTL